VWGAAVLEEWLMEGFDDQPGHIWYNGALVPWKEATTHVLTHALHYASCVFEGERAYNGRIFKLVEHTERLFNGADVMGMDVPYTPAEMNAACDKLVEVQGITDGYVRPVIWRGSEMMGVSAQDTRINVAIAAWDWPSYFSPEARMKGIRLKTSEWRRPSPETAPVHAKAAGLYMICTLSKHAAEAEGFDDCLMLDWRGHVSEATGANIFLSFGDGKLHTPTPDCFLNGITRQTVIELAKRRDIEVIERTIMPDELKDATEIFLTGTAAEVTPVGVIDDLSFTVGEISKWMMDDYDEIVGKQSPENSNEDQSATE